MAQILIVDDSPTETHLMREMLEKNGFSVISAENGAIGVQMARLNKPDLVLMDVVMPELNGFQATRQLSKDPATAHIPIIIVTTKDQATDRLWGLKQGAKDYLTKPLTEKALISTVKNLLGQA
jgi:twitching motility two-component system response regulator PilH